MIRCDYDQCEGWYHLECVGFKDKTEEEITKIKWYCSEDCRDVKRKKYFLIIIIFFLESNTTKFFELQAYKEKK